jgi:hypothetical protein
MKTATRTRTTAAAMLLASLGALMAAQPAAAQQRFHRDQRPPQVFDITPSQGDRVGDRGLTRVSARFADDRSGVDYRSVTLRVDGRDVTRNARIANDELRYRADLAPGRHTAEVVVRDRAGNLTRRAWTFAVVDRDRGHYSYNNHGYNGNRW